MHFLLVVAHSRAYLAISKVMATVTSLQMQIWHKAFESPTLSFKCVILATLRCDEKSRTLTVAMLVQCSTS